MHIKCMQSPGYPASGTGTDLVDNGSEFSDRALDLWACRHQVRIDFSRPGKPTDNGLIESFNGSPRGECLNLHWFETLDDARTTIEASCTTSPRGELPRENC